MALAGSPCRNNASPFFTLTLAPEPLVTASTASGSRTTGAMVLRGLDALGVLLGSSFGIGLPQSAACPRGSHQCLAVRRRMRGQIASSVSNEPTEILFNFEYRSEGIHIVLWFNDHTRLSIGRDRHARVQFCTDQNPGACDSSQVIRPDGEA